MTRSREEDEPSEREVAVAYAPRHPDSTYRAMGIPFYILMCGMLAAFLLVALDSEFADNMTTATIAIIAPVLGVLGFYFGLNSGRSKRPRLLPKPASVADIERSVEMITASDIITRLAGIHALESVARQKLGGRGAVVDVLSAFVRERSRSQEGDKPPHSARESTDAQVSADILEALQVLSRLNDSDVRIDLKGAYLPRAELTKLDLSRADLSGAVLDGSDLSFSTLDGATLRGASLRGCRAIEISISGAVLHKADLTKSLLPSANISGALLSFALLVDVFAAYADFSQALLGDADLTRANLQGVKLTGAYLGGANLSDARLEGVSLEGVNLLDADLTGAIMPSSADEPPTKDAQ